MLPAPPSQRIHLEESQALLVLDLDDVALKAFLVIETLVEVEKEEMETQLGEMERLEAPLKEDKLLLETLGSL